MEHGRKLWLATRKSGIGGSDAAAILGLSPWKSQMDVWMDKRGIVPERTDPDKEFLLDLGQRLEPVIAGLYEKETGEVLTVPVPKIWMSNRYPILLGSPDRFVRDKDIGVELKSENQFTEAFGDPGTDEVPDHYLIQCAHYMAVMDWDRWDIAVLHGGTRFQMYSIHRDLDLEKQMIEKLLAWWDKHIAQGIPPDVDSSDAWRVYLHQKHPMELQPIKIAEVEEAVLMEKLHSIREAERFLAAIHSTLENQLKAAIGDHIGIVSPFGKATWKRTKDTDHTDWQQGYVSLRQAASEALAAGGAPGAASTFETLADTILGIYTNTRPGVRRFLFTPTKELKHGSRIGESGKFPLSIDAIQSIAALGAGVSSPGGPGESDDRGSLRDGGETSPGHGRGEGEAPEGL